MYNAQAIITHFIDNASGWSIALALGLAFFAAIWILFRVLSKKLILSDANSFRLIGGMLGKVSPAFLIVASLYLTLKISPAPDKIIIYAKMIFMVAFWVQFTLIIFALINFWLKPKQNQDGDSITMFNAIGIFLKLATIVLCILLALQTLGFNVSTLIAGLGIGGMAVALAAQSILGDMFASISILLDKPFVVGDVISTPDFKGVVEHIGLKTTTLRGENGEQIICSNSGLLKYNIRNYKRINERKVTVQIGVVYELSADKLSQISGLLKQAFEGVENCKFERAHLKGFSDSAINYEILYSVLGEDFMLYMNVQEKINLAIFASFAQNGIGFAYPTQTVYNHNAN